MHLGKTERVWSAVKSWLSPKPGLRKRANPPLSILRDGQLNSWGTLLYLF